MELANGRFAADLGKIDTNLAGYFIDVNYDIWSTVERYDRKLERISPYGYRFPCTRLQGRFYNIDMLVYQLKESGEWDEAISEPFRKPSEPSADELRAKIASHEYGAELCLQQAMRIIEKLEKALLQEKA